MTSNKDITKNKGGVRKAFFSETVYIFSIISNNVCRRTGTTCDKGIIYKSTCYKIHRQEPVSWFTAVNRCLSNNGSLAVFDDDILTYFTSTLLTQGPLWIGLIKSWWTWPDTGVFIGLFNHWRATFSLQLVFKLYEYTST